MIKKIKSEKKGVRKVILKIFLVLLILCLIGFAVLGGMNIFMIANTKEHVYSMEELPSPTLRPSSSARSSVWRASTRSAEYMRPAAVIMSLSAGTA